MTDHFDKWINGMDEDMYEDWLEDEATDAQEEKALNIRTPLSEREEIDIDAEQGAIQESSSVIEVETKPEPRRINRIIDTLKNAGVRRDAIRINTLADKNKINLPSKNITAPISDKLPPAIITTPRGTPVSQKRNIVQVLQNAVSRFRGIFRSRK